MADDIVKEYSNGEITVVWKPKVCIHSGKCVKSLSKVFDPHRWPWIDMKAAGSDDIMATIDQCPSGTLSYRVEGEKKAKTETQAASEDNALAISLMKDGPYIVTGNFKVLDADKNVIETKQKVALCRCGASKNKPFCDGAHKNIDFKG